MCEIRIQERTGKLQKNVPEPVETRIMRALCEANLLYLVFKRKAVTNPNVLE